MPSIEHELTVTLDQQEDIVAFPDLRGAWIKSAGAGYFMWIFALTTDGRYILQLNTRGTSDLELIREVIVFSRKHEDTIMAACPLTFVTGFSTQRAGFDVIASCLPIIHNHDPLTSGPTGHRLRENTYAIFPGYRCEFSGLESQREAQVRFHQMRPANLERGPAPFVRLRYDIPSIGGGTLGKQRGFHGLSTLNSAITGMVDAPDSFLEFENYQGQVARVEWQEGLLLSFGDREADVTTDQMLEWAHTFIYDGAS